MAGAACVGSTGLRSPSLRGEAVSPSVSGAESCLSTVAATVSGSSPARPAWRGDVAVSAGRPSTFVLTRLAAYYAPHNEQDDNHHCGDNADNQIRIHGSSLKTATDSCRNTTYVALLQPSRRLIGLLAQTLPLSRPYISNRGRRWYRQICHQCIKRHTRRHRIASGPMIFNIEQVGQWCPTLIVVILATATENTYQTGHARHDVMVVELARRHRRGHIRLHDRLSSAARPTAKT